MEKQKKAPFRIDWQGIWEWIKDNTFELILGGVLIICFGAMAIGLTMAILSKTRSPETRFAQYKQYYAECIETGIAEQACEMAALSYAGLDNND